MTESDCPACEAALKNPASGALRADCIECRARYLARSPIYAEASASRTINGAYKAALIHAFGQDEWFPGHKRVRAWAERALRTEAP